MISVIIPLYNKEQCILKTLHSILNQSYTDFEIVVVNDGSTDNSYSIVSSINDKRIRVINQKNSGVSNARNTGIINACGEWLLFLDADDILEESSLLSLHSLSKKYPSVNVLSGNFITRNNDGKSIIESSLIGDQLFINAPKLLWQRKWNIRLGSFIVKSSIVTKEMYFPEFMSKGEDVLFVYRIIEKNNVAYTSHTIMTYMRENSSLSKKKFKQETILPWNLSCQSHNFYHSMNCSLIVLRHWFHRAIRFEFYTLFRNIWHHRQDIPMLAICLILFPINMICNWRCKPNVPKSC